jgi:hypothetical protein
MKIRNFIWLGVIPILGMLAACRPTRTFEISNPYDQDLMDRATVLDRSEVIPYLDDTVNLTYVAAKDQNGEWLPTQCDDMDGDGTWDELVFLSDLEAGETKKITLERVDQLSKFPARTNIRFGRMTKPFKEVSGDLRMKTSDTKYSAPVYQMEGPAWENDLIAFRNYFDARSGIDIFGKRTSDLVMDSVGLNGRDYHTLADWGMDILKVGNSLGAGAIAIGIGDSLYRVGPCEAGTYRLIAEGPVRAILELYYKNVPAGNRQYSITHRISLNAGDRFYRSEVWISDLQGDEELVTGIVNLHDVPADTLSQGHMKIIYSLGNQGISGEVLGMGLIIPVNQLKSIREAPATGPGIISTHLVSLTLEKDVPAEYCFLAAWEMQEPQVKDREFFIGLLKEAIRKISNQSQKIGK